MTHKESSNDVLVSMIPTERTVYPVSTLGKTVELFQGIYKHKVEPAFQKDITDIARLRHAAWRVIRLDSPVPLLHTFCSLSESLRPFEYRVVTFGELRKDVSGIKQYLDEELAIEVRLTERGRLSISKRNIAEQLSVNMLASNIINRLIEGQKQDKLILQYGLSFDIKNVEWVTL